MKRIIAALFIVVFAASFAFAAGQSDFRDAYKNKNNDKVVVDTKNSNDGKNAKSGNDRNYGKYISYANYPKYPRWAKHRLRCRLGYGHFCRPFASCWKF